MASNVSSIAQALAAAPESLHPRKVSLARLERGKSCLFVSAAKHALRVNGLPTPPNSISPNLPPQGFEAKTTRDLVETAPLHVDSDIDLEDAVHHANSHAIPFSEPLYPSEAHGIITPAYLAQHHLPNIVLDQGPIAIRHVMNKLIEIVPGFSDIPPAKARRIVVSALESRVGGGLRGDAEFEKVGWGKWDAKVRGQSVAMRERSVRPIQEGPLSPTALPTLYSARSGALRIPGATQQRPRFRKPSPGSWIEETALTAPPVDPDSIMSDRIEDEADKMSIDGDEEAERRDRGGSDHPYEALTYSDTDEEDWKAMGAAALRKSSVSGGARSRYFSTSLKSRSKPPMSRSMPSQGPPHQRPNFAPLDFTGVDADSQERAAIEALMAMGSV